MTKQKRKKPTIKELTTVVNSLITEMDEVKNRISSIEVVLTEYIAWKKDEKKYKKHFKKLIEDRAGNSLRVDKQ